jgi:hypothetical protein
MVGDAPNADSAIARPIVLIVGSRGTSCTGVAIARDLVLTEDAHGRIEAGRKQW